MSKHQQVLERAMTRLRLKQLRLLVAIDRHGSIQAAAREVHVSQPAATKMIRDLEEDFEATLFSRTNRGVVPTEAGNALIFHSKLLLTQISNAAQDLDDLTEGKSGHVVVGTLLAAAPLLLPTAIEGLLHERPKVAVKVIEGANAMLIPGLLSGELDMIVGRLPTYNLASNLSLERLIDEKIVIIAGRQHPLVGKSGLTFKDLKDFSWILPPSDTTLRRQVDHFFTTRENYAPPSVIDSVSYLTNRSLLSTRNFLYPVPEHVAKTDIAAGILSVIDWDVPFGIGPVGITHRGDEFLSPAASAFRSALRVAARQIS